LGQVSAEASAWQNDGTVHHSPQTVGTGHSENEFIGWAIEMKKLWSLLQHRVVWTSGAALLVIVAAPAMVGLVLKALGLVHGASLHTWLFDVGQNMGADGAAGSLGSTGACAAGDPGDPGDDGGSTDNLLDQLRKGIWPYANPNNGPQLYANPGMIGAPIQSPSNGSPGPVFQGFSGDTGDKIGQAVDLLDALKTYAKGAENNGTAADPVEDVE
jgi:hypothetical protein